MKIILPFLFVVSLTCFKASAQNCTVNAGVDIQYCPGEQMKLFGNVTGLYNGPTITWSQISGPAVTISNTNSLTTNCGTATAGATYVFQISSQCQDGNTATDQVTYTVAANTPTPPATNAGTTINAGCVQWGGSVTLGATAAPPGFIGTWSIVSGGQGSFSSASSPTSTFTPIQQSPANPSWVCPANTNSYVLRWTLVSTTPPPASCPSAQTSTSANVTVNIALFNPVDARAVTPGCGNATADVQLYGTCPGTGTSNWTLISGPSGYTFTPVNTKDVTITNPPTGTYTFRYSVTGTSPCPTGTKDVTFTHTQGANFAVTTSAANAGGVKAGFCNGEPFPTTAQLSANLVNAGETGTWSQVGGGSSVTFSNINNANTTVSGMTNAGAPYTFRWTIANATGCSSFSDVIFKPVPNLTPINLNSGSACNAIFGFTGGASSCGSGLKMQLESLAGPPNTNIPNTQGWYISGYYLNSRPDGSGVSLGYKPNRLLQFNRLGIQGNHGSEASDDCNTGMGLLIGMFSNSQGTNYKFYSFLQNTYRNFIGAYSGTVIIKNTDCDATYSYPFSVTVTRDVSNSNAGTDQNLACGVTSTNLAGNDPLVTAPNYGRGSWQQIAGPNTATIADIYNRSSLVSSLIPGTYAFTWTINSGTVCPPRLDTVLIRVSNAAPTAVTAGTNRTLCFGTPVTLTADLNPTGNLANMLQTTGSTGTWTLLSQTPAGAAPVIANPTSISTAITGTVASTVYVFRYTASNLCGSQTADVTITTSATQGPSAADAGALQCLGAGGAITLSATAPSPGTGTWTKLNVGDPGTITTPGSNTTTVTGATPNGVYGYLWTVGGIGGCANSLDTVYVSNTGALSAATARANLDTCATGTGNTFTLFATAPVNGTGSWVQTSGPSTAIFNPNTATTVVTLPLVSGKPVNGTYRFNWVVSNGTCTNNTDEVVVNFFNRSSPAVITTLPANLCAPSNGVISISAEALSSGTGAWSIISGGGTIASVTSASTTATLNAGSNTLRWTSSSENGAICPSSYDDVVVTYSPAAFARDTGFCRATSTLLKGSHAGIGTGAWSLISGPNTPTLTQQGTQDSVASASPLVQGTYVFRYSVTNATCGNSFDDVTVTIDDVTDPNAGVDILCDSTGTTISLSGSAIPVGATALWSLFTTPAGASTGTFSPATAANTVYSTPNVGGVYNFKYEFTKGGCKISDYVQAQVTSRAAAGTDQKICNGATTFTLNGATTATGETGLWSFLYAGSSSAVITNTALRNSTVTNVALGDSLVLIWRITGVNTSCQNQDTVVILNKAAAAAAAGTGASPYCDNAIGLDLAGNAPTPGTGAWSLVTAPAGAPPIVWTNQNSQTANVKNLKIGTYTFRYTITNAPCPSTNNVVSINSTCIPLPVSLISFTAKVDNCNAKISWETASEINSLEYILEKSEDGINWQFETRINAAVNSSTTKSYQYNSSINTRNIMYYRLKMVDVGGQFTYSSVITAKCSNNITEVSIHPNPVKDIAIITGVEVGNIIKLLTIDGKLIRQLKAVSNTQVLETAHLSSGIYIINIYDKENGHSYTMKLLKQ